MPLLSPRTGFSCPEYTITIGGEKIDPRSIVSMKLTRQSEPVPVKGVVESELYLSLHTKFSFEPNAEIKISVGAPYLMTYANHYISKISRKGSLLTIRAHDRIRTCENMFDDSSLDRTREPFFTYDILSMIAGQCEFEGCEGADFTPLYLYYDDIHGKTCREILDLLSRHTVGVWYCNNENVLRFTYFTEMSCEIGSVEEKCAPVYLHSVKGPFTQFYGENTSSGEIYRYGHAGHFRNILKLSGSLFSKELLDKIAERVSHKSIQAFSCSYISILGAPDGLSAFTFYEYPDTFISSKTTVHFTGSTVYAEAMAADICEDESDYIDVTGYELRKRILQGRRYGSTVFTPNGIGFSAYTGDDIRGEDISLFSAESDRITKFGGAMLDGVMPDSIESVSENRKKIRYGDSVYVLSFDKASDGTKSNIKFEREGSA